MAFKDMYFLKTRMSEAVKSVLVGGYEQRLTAEELIQALAEHGWKVTVRYRFKDGSWIFSCTTTEDHKFPDYCISSWHSNFEGVTLKTEAFLSLLDSYNDNPMRIERAIQETEAEITALVEEHLLNLNKPTP